MSDLLEYLKKVTWAMGAISLVTLYSSFLYQRIMYDRDNNESLFTDDCSRNAYVKYHVRLMVTVSVLSSLLGVYTFIFMVIFVFVRFYVYEKYLPETATKLDTWITRNLIGTRYNL